MNETNRFHFAVGLYSDYAQRTSKCGKNISHAYSPAARSIRLCSYHVLTSSVIRVQMHSNQYTAVSTKVVQKSIKVYTTMPKGSMGNTQ